MSDKSMFLAAAFMAGAVLPLQALVNARLGTAIGGPMVAAAVSVGVGTLTLVGLILLLRLPLPQLSDVAALPWWVWIGGALGAYYVASTAYSAPVIGAASLIALIVLGQMLASLAMDHFGILTVRQPISFERLAGAVLLFVGVWLIVRPTAPVDPTM